MRIGELAKRTDCDVETVRYYEKAGLLQEPGRNSAGYREYRKNTVSGCNSSAIAAPCRSA